MNVNECVKKSIRIAADVYNNNIPESYFDNMVENVLWYGIAIGQNIRGVKTLREVWSGFSNTLTFSLGDVEAEYIQTSQMSCEVMLTYTVTIHYPNGDNVLAFQRTQLSWADTVITDENNRRKRVPKIFMVHISNPVEYHAEDYVYPEHYSQLPPLTLTSSAKKWGLVTIR